MRLIADTGLIVALLNRGDAHHRWALALAGQSELPWITCEPVLAEAAWHLRDTERVMELLKQDVTRIGLSCSQEAPALAALGRRYADRGPDLSDLSVVRLSELHPKHVVATVDRRDFSIYRRFGRQTIPIVCPATD